MTEPARPRMRWLGRPAKIIAAVVLGGGLLWVLFQAVDGLLLPEQTATARVVAKKIWDPGGAYFTETINNRPVITRQDTSPAFIVELDLEGRPAEAAVDKELYDAVHPGERVQVVYQTRRLTGALQVVGVTRSVSGD